MLSKGIKKLLFISVFTVYQVISVFAVTDHIKVSIITIDPGKEVYTLFGHTAIRIQDDWTGVDEVYNFGTFDFNIPVFYLKFIRGNLQYTLSVTDFGTFTWNMENERRTVREQVIDLSPEEKILLRKKLNLCYQTNCRYYTYDFFHNNCATKVRDYLNAVRVNPLQYDSAKYCCETFRSLITPYVKRNYWLQIGVNLALGKKADIAAGSYEYMFLPLNIHSILNNSGTIVSDSILRYGYPGKSGTSSWWLPVFITGVMISLSFVKKSMKIPLMLLSFILGITGLILLMISIYSQIPALTANMNIYWTLPALLVLITGKTKPGKYIKVAYLVMLVVMLIAWNTLPQKWSATFIPWIIAMIVLLIADLMPLRPKSIQG